MTPAFYDADHMLLRAQLKCLSVQTVKDFDVWLIDPHYYKRRSVIPELAERLKLTINHVPYTPCTRIAKYFDCAIFNAAFCYSQSPLNLRYSCYRFAKPTLVESVLSAPPLANVDLMMHAVGPDLGEVAANAVEKKAHKGVWWFDSEDVDWSRFPAKSGYLNENGSQYDPVNSLANWPPFMDQAVTVPTSITGNVYGNIAWRRDQWLALNGTNEVITNAAHWEDLDFDTRAANAKQKMVRYPHLLYRLHHHYGGFSQRSNVQVDVPLTRMCSDCYKMIFCNHGDADFGVKLNARLKDFSLKHYYQHRAWVCTTCSLSGAIYDGNGLDHYFFHLQDMGITQSPILRQERIGRNLRTLAEHMDKCPYLSSKILIYNDSWDNEFYYY